MVVIYDPAPPQVLTGGKLENHWKHYWKFNIFVQIHVRRQLFGCSNNVDVVDEKKTKDRDVRLRPVDVGLEEMEYVQISSADLLW